MAESTKGVGGVFQELLNKILEITEKAAKSVTIRRILEDLSPLVQEIKHYNNDLENPKEEIQKLVSEMEAGEKGFNPIPKRSRIFSLPVSCHKLRGKGSQREVEEILSQVRDTLVLLTKENINLGQRNYSTQMKAPENPEFTVGLDLLFIKLKMELLKDGVSILGLTGLGGSGKTTLAKKLCWDEQVRGKFRENILFITFSKTPNFKIIVQTLFQRTGYSVPEFQSNEDAATRLGVLLKHIGETPILMVLDDVWPGSECLVDKFRVKLSDYKILVTSRVAFPKMDIQIRLGPLCHGDAMTLFRYFAQLKDNNSDISEEYLVEEVVRGCRGSPLALKIIGRSLCQQPFEVWQKMVKEWSQGHSIFYSNTDLLSCLQKSLDVLEDERIINECFIDLGLFPEDQRIPVAALVDMWAELYKLDNKGIDAMAIINKLATRNLANVIVTRKVACDADNYYNNHFIMQHDLLRELAIYQISQVPFEQRKRVIIDINGVNSQWCVKEKQRGTIARILSSFPKCYVKQKQHKTIAQTLPLLAKWWFKQTSEVVFSCQVKSLFAKWCFKPKQQQAIARTLSISTDETLTSDLFNIQTAEAEVLILNLRATQYNLTEFMKKMSKLKVLIVTNYGIYPCELKNFEILSSLSNLKRIRLEKISVPFLCKLTNVQKLSLYMCDIMKAFNSSIIRISDALPNLLEIYIDYCNDLVELPAGFCDITSLKKLSITNCHKLSALPSEIRKLENLEVLRLSSCTDLTELPDSIKSLSKLSFLDISDCISCSQLPEHIGELRGLKKLCIRGCSRLSELPSSVMNLANLEAAICDKETAVLLEDFESMLPNLRIEVPEADINLNWLRGDRFSSG